MEFDEFDDERQDKILVCRDCGEDFIFSVREQDFFAQKGFTNEPTRCPTCRAARKQNMAHSGSSAAPRGNQRPVAMGNRAPRSGGGDFQRSSYNSGNRRDDGYSSGGGYGRRDQQSQERKLYNVICANCGTETQVPFMPRQGAPVYCKSCYNSRKSGQY